MEQLKTKKKKKILSKEYSVKKEHRRLNLNCSTYFGSLGKCNLINAGSSASST